MHSFWSLLLIRGMTFGRSLTLSEPYLWDEDDDRTYLIEFLGVVNEIMDVKDLSKWSLVSLSQDQSTS